MAVNDPDEADLKDGELFCETDELRCWSRQRKSGYNPSQGKNCTEVASTTLVSHWVVQLFSIRFSKQSHVVFYSFTGEAFGLRVDAKGCARIAEKYVVTVEARARLFSPALVDA